MHPAATGPVRHDAHHPGKPSPRVTDLGQLRLLSRIVDQVGEGVAVVDNDARIVYANTEFARMHRCSLDELHAQQFVGSDFYASDDWAGPVQELMKQALDEGIGRSEVTRRRTDGTTFAAHITLSLLRDDAGDLVGRILCVQDVTERCEAVAQLRANERRLADAQEIARLGSWEWDLVTGTMKWSDQLFRITGLPNDWAPDYERFLHRIDRADRQRVKDAVQTSLLTGRPYDVIYRVPLPGRPDCIVHARGDVVTDAAGAPVVMRGTVQDVTEAKVAEASLREANARMEELATRDQLTGLTNRSLFSDRLDQALAMGARGQRNVAVLFVDVDRFKNINDSLGHHCGDEVLVEVSSRIVHALRASDTVARLGDDEFAVLLGGSTTPEEAAAAAERVLAALRPPFTGAGIEFFVGASIGVALWPEDCGSKVELLQHADVAMHRAKAAGGNRFEMFQPAMTVAAHEHLRMEADLRRAVDGEEFFLRYHPQVDLVTGAVTGVESLLRWAHPSSGEIGPDTFIPLAEETALILPIGDWVLGEACRQAARWRAELDTPLCMAVNVSPLQLAQPDFVETVVRVLAETGLPPSALELEVTESILIEDTGPAIRALRALRELGVGLAIDDFGTGYSSLSSLRRFLVDRVKLDMSLISELGKGDDSAREGNGALVAAAINLAHALGLPTVAEGIVHERQVQTLASFGCEQGQGFYWTQPLLASELPPWLADRPGHPPA
ncbi:MAG: putative bifunctional diguanylate cyclase/phosphodiesterase [Acidimicrobiales bacterium]